MSVRQSSPTLQVIAEPEAAARGLSRGWLVVAGALLVQMVGYGAIYSCSAFAEAIAASFGAVRAEVALVYALSGAGALLLRPAPMAPLPGPDSAAAVPRRQMAPIYAGTLLVSLGIALPYALLEETAHDLGLPPHEAVALPVLVVAALVLAGTALLATGRR